MGHSRRSKFKHIDTDFARGLAWQHYTAPRMAQQWEDLILR